jgi:hypothetical protein
MGFSHQPRLRQPVGLSPSWSTHRFRAIPDLARRWWTTVSAKAMSRQSFGDSSQSHDVRCSAFGVMGVVHKSVPALRVQLFAAICGLTGSSGQDTNVSHVLGCVYFHLRLPSPLISPLALLLKHSAADRNQHLRNGDSTRLHLPGIYFLSGTQIRLRCGAESERSCRGSILER